MSVREFDDISQNAVAQAKSEAADVMIDTINECVNITGKNFVLETSEGKFEVTKSGRDMDTFLNDKKASKEDVKQFIKKHGVMDRVKSEFGNYIIKEIEKAPENTKHTLESLAGKAGGLLQKAIGTMGR